MASTTDMSQTSDEETYVKKVETTIKRLQCQMYCDHISFEQVSDTHCNYKGCANQLSLSPYRFYCAEHNPLATGLEIRPSTIPGAGDGLFVRRELMEQETKAIAGSSFEEDDVIDVYGGKIFPIGPLLPGNIIPVPKLEDSTYLFAHLDKYFVDGKSTKSCLARWANSDKTRENAHFVPYSTGKNSPSVTLLKAKRALHSGEEIFVNYGDRHDVSKILQNEETSCSSTSLPSS